MAAFRAELAKLRRSLSWVVVLLLPAVLVVSGSVTTVVNGEPLDDGWHTLWLRSLVFYGMFPLQVGIAILASLVWRVEHRDGNWNALMAGPTPSWRVLGAKAGTVAVLAAAMQLVVLAGVTLLGSLVFGLPGLPPVRYLVATVMIMVAGVPVAVLQSWLSMAMRSFAGPVAVGFLAAAGSMAMLVLELDGAALASPYALVSRSTQLGTDTFADSGEISIAVLLPLVAAAVVMSVVVLLLSTAALERSDTRT